MRFKICSVGWNCAQFLQWTLDSVAMQELTNWDMAVIYDKSDDNGAELIKKWAAEDPEHRLYQIRTSRMFAPYNQYDAVHNMLKPEDDDIVIFLDLDGDKLAHPRVFNVLKEAYDDGALVTYGQYRPVPPTPQHSKGMACEWPKEVVENRTYRQHTRFHGPCFNHLRTASGRVVKAIPQSYFKWANGKWYKGATDYVVMLAALELANGRHKFIKEVILDYNHANPNADNTNRYKEGRPGYDATADIVRRRPLPPLPREVVVPVPEETTTPVYGRDAPGSKDLYMSADQRREVIRAYGKHFQMQILVETGTNDGGTPWMLRNDFQEIFTIELGEDLWSDAVQRFAEYPHIHCIRGDSGEVLPHLLPQLKQPALFWLDGHYSGGITAHGDLDTPVVQELEAIFADKRPHIILVDDARIFKGGPEQDMYPHYEDYPSQDWVAKIAKENHYDFVLLDDIMRLTPDPEHWH